MKKINDFNILGITIQVILTICVIVFFLISLFHSKFFPYLYLFFSFDLFVMGYNNLKVYKRKNITVLYFIVGFIIFIYSILSFFGVI